MQQGKGSDDFDSYVGNIRQASVTSSIGTQLAPGYGDGQLRSAMVHNPYVSTIADLGICRFRLTDRMRAARR